MSTGEMKKNDATSNYFSRPKRGNLHFCQPPDINGLQTCEQANLTQRQNSDSSFIAAAGDTTAKHREAVLIPTPQPERLTNHSQCEYTGNIRCDNL
jgi:hypothetical protein